MITTTCASGILNLCQMKVKTPPAQDAAGADHYVCKWSICTSWWRENTTMQHNVQSSGPVSGQGGAECSNSMQLLYSLHTTDQIRASMGAVGDCLMQQSMQHALGHVEVIWCALTQVALIAASCTPMAPVLVLIWSVIWWL